MKAGFWWIFSGFLLLGCSETEEEKMVQEISVPDEIVEPERAIVLPEIPDDVGQENYDALKEKITFLWDGDFSQVEKRKMRRWLVIQTQYTQDILGEYPFQMTYVLHRFDSTGKAVTFGYTRQRQQHTIHFYVDPSVAYDEFFTDWRAPHEICHMAVPFVGRENAWFAEGFATYMSRKVMVRSGVFTEEEIEEEYQAKLEKHEDHFCSEELFELIVDSLSMQRDFDAMYWVSTAYFYAVDKRLHKEYNTDLCNVIRNYQAVLVPFDQTVEDVIVALDHVSETTVFSEQLDLQRTVSADSLYQRLLLWFY